jgi:membrane protein DedA with SNARE-associated domain
MILAAQAAHQSSTSGWLLLAVIASAVYAAWKIRKWRKNRKKG